MKLTTSCISCLFITLSALTLSAQDERAWTSLSGSVIKATFVSRDEHSVTLLRSDNKKNLVVPIDKLDKHNQAFVEENHPFEDPDATSDNVQGTAFGPLDFGDTREQVEKKLLRSSTVKTEVNQELFGRTGLNGIFETSTPIGGLPCHLYFDWSDSGNLKEVSIRTKSLSIEEYDSTLQASWDEMVTLFGNLYGKSLSATSFPIKEDLQNGLMISSHLWRTGNGNSVLVGTTKDHTGYNVTARFTTERIQPVITTGP